MFKKYKISIITVTYNAEKTLEKTIKSVINQTYNNIEYLIIDGASTEGTIDIIKKYEKHIDFWISEPDKGIYDAMNKGIKNSTGEIIYFLNADDYLYDKNVVSDVIDKFNDDNSLDIVCGEIMIVDHRFNTNYITSRGNRKNIIKISSPPPHQGTFMKRKIFIENNYFDSNYKIAADFDLFCKCYLKKYKIQYINRVIAYFKKGGRGSNKKLAYKEQKKIRKKYFGSLSYYNYSMTNFLLNSIHELLTKLNLLKIHYKFKSYIKTIKRRLQRYT